MNDEARQHLLAERSFLLRMLAKTPEKATLTRMSDQARLRKVEDQLAELPARHNAPARARITFDGAPVVNGHGIFAEFGTKAINSFAEAVSSIAASLSAPLAPVGPIPNREQNQLLITNTAVGSFGFELEEHSPHQSDSENGSPVAIALDRTQTLLASTLGDDDELADIASETDPRALEKVRAFLKVLADNNAICTLQYGDGGVRFSNVGQVNRSLARLASDNLHETEEQLQGEFLGVLPNSRSFEFKLDDNGQVIRGKVSTRLQNLESLNDHLHEPAQIDVARTQVGNGQPRYLLVGMPVWLKSRLP